MIKALKGLFLIEKMLHNSSSSLKTPGCTPWLGQTLLQ